MYQSPWLPNFAISTFRNSDHFVFTNVSPFFKLYSHEKMEHSVFTIFERKIKRGKNWNDNSWVWKLVRSPRVRHSFHNSFPNNFLPFETRTCAEDQFTPFINHMRRNWGNLDDIIFFITVLFYIPVRRVRSSNTWFVASLCVDMRMRGQCYQNGIAQHIGIIVYLALCTAQVYFGDKIILIKL